MVVMVTHEAREADVLDSLARMAASPAVSGQPVMMHILDF
jgi:homoserine dehydrogenase